jgi:hypothetical protein
LPRRILVKKQTYYIAVSNPFASPGGTQFSQGPSDPFGMTSFTPDPKAQGSQGSQRPPSPMSDRDFLDIQVTSKHFVQSYSI